MDVIGFRMKDLRDAYQVTDNLGKPGPCSPRPHLAHLDAALEPQFPVGPPGQVLG